MKKAKPLIFGILIASIVVIFSLLMVPAAVVLGIAHYEDNTEITPDMRGSSGVINNNLYASRYKKIVTKYLLSKGYVSLERLVFYLQRTYNVLDITLLSDEEWENAYLNNLDEEHKQMIPTKTLCKNFKENTSLPEYTIQSGRNENNILIEALNLCYPNGFDITEIEEESESFQHLPYDFPLKTDFTVTSIVFENRDVDLGLPEEEQERVNYHSGWDLAVPTGTEFYSVCDGVIEKNVVTQANDLPYQDSHNATGNYIEVRCLDKNHVSYLHIQAGSVPYLYKPGTKIEKGAYLGKTSTTGLSNGPHLHLGLTNENGVRMDIMKYINFKGEDDE